MLRERGFWPVLALVVIAHGAVLTQWRTAPWSVEDRPDRPPTTQVFQVRPVQPAAPTEGKPPAAAAGPSQAPPAPAPQPQPAAPAVAGAVPPVDPPYIPRSQLTVPPRLAASVDVLFPPDVQGVVNLTVQATLFIDEDGIVRRVRVETPGVHPSFERAILEAFSSARFSPGELEGLPVRSQLRVEVEFHAPGLRR